MTNGPAVFTDTDMHMFSPKDLAGRIARVGLMSFALVCAPIGLGQDTRPVKGAEAAVGEQRQYTFAWMFADGTRLAPRGGTTRGPAVSLADTTAPQFIALQEPGLSDRERDRRAILAMAGDYRTSFDFIETMGFTPDYNPPAPYQSWGTERIYVVADEPEFVSLQHIIVMHFQRDDGSVSEPMVVKHWRQDWRFEDREVHEFMGHGSWQRTRLSRRAARGRWSQTVYQVDDSPRYEALGRWTHSPGLSVWKSEVRRRPLPRREFSVRDDYHALLGTHRISIYPGGWSQEEDALKLVLDENNQSVDSQPYLAREAGLSRYERIRDYDFAAGDLYWQQTAEFWSVVRDFWDRVYASSERFSLRDRVGGKPLFATLFDLSSQASEDITGDENALQAAIETAIEPYLVR